MAHAYLTRHYVRCRASIPGNANERAVSRKHPRTFAIAIKRRSTARWCTLPRLIKQRVVIAPVRKMQMQSESLEDAHRARCVYRAICYDILRLNLHTQQPGAVWLLHTHTHTETHAYGQLRPNTHTEIRVRGARGWRRVVGVSEGSPYLHEQ